jgi:hypothetical protein
MLDYGYRNVNGALILRHQRESPATEPDEVYGMPEQGMPSTTNPEMRNVM